MRKATWKIIDRGVVPEITPAVDFTCQCGHEASLPVMGLAMAQIGMALVFDTGKHAMPDIIQCRKCRRTFVGPNVREDI
jgi:hypothetical protein